jgi:predicted secreted hydrolase
MSTTKNGVASKLTRGEEEGIAKGGISRTPLSNWLGDWRF